jgi:hypothetical protein
VRPYLEKKKSQNRAGGVAQGVGPEFKPQYCQKKISLKQKKKKKRGRTRTNFYKTKQKL